MFQVLSLLAVFISATSAQYGEIAIEVNFTLFSNPDGIRDRVWGHQSCDFFSRCDNLFHVYIDTESAGSAYPGYSLPVNEWIQIRPPSGYDTSRLNKVLVAKRSEDQYKVDDFTKGILVHFRVLAQDEDDISKHDVIDRFDCSFTGIPANSSATAPWIPGFASEDLKCWGEIHYGRAEKERPTVHYRYRMYKTELPTANQDLIISDWENEVYGANNGLEKLSILQKVKSRFRK